MDVLTCTLMADGASDRVLIPILQWLLDRHCPSAYALNFAERLSSHSNSLGDRITAALADYPCNLLFVHRDAEADAPASRQQEIEAAWASQRQLCGEQLVTIVPVRMTEAWLLVDEAAIRAASGNPNGSVALNLPKLSKLEQLIDPKAVLFDALRTAADLPPGRLKSFSPDARRHRVSDLMKSSDPPSFTALSALPSFAGLETQVQQRFHR